jgi:hypothetical protein
VADGVTNQTATVTVYGVPTASLVATTNPVLYNGTTTLTPTFTNGTGKIGTTGAGSNDLTASATSGSGVGSLAQIASKTYTLTVTNVPGQTATSAVTVTVQPVVVAAIAPASANVTVGYTQAFSSSVTQAATTTLTWAVDGVVGGNAAVGTISAGGLYTAGSTTGAHTIKATAVADGVTNQTATATVYGVPTASLVATTNPVLYNGTTTLTPTFTNGTGKIGTSGAGSSDLSASATSGSGVGSLAQTTSKTYTLTVTNVPGQTATSAVTVTVQTVSVGAISGGGGYLSVGYGRTMSATASNATNTNITWSATGGSFSPTTTASGANTTWTAPGSGGTYTIYATSASGSGTQTSTTVTVVALPTISSIAGSPSSMTVGQSSTVTSNFSNGTGSVDWFGAVNSGQGYGTGALGGSRTYTLTVTNLAGQTASSAATVTVYAAATVSVTVDATNITAGGGTYLNWSSSGANSVNISNYGNGLATSGRSYIAPGGTTTYTGTAYNPVGMASATSSATVNVYLVSSSSLTLDATNITAGQGTYLRWSASNVSRVYIAGLVDTAAASGAVWVAPGSSTGYAVRTWNALGDEGSGASVTLNVYPVSSGSIWLDTTNITAGGGTYLRWSSSNSSGGVLVDGVGWTSASGAVWIAPGATTGYGIRTWNALGVEGGGASTQLNVYPASSGSIWLDSTSITAGNGTTLRWSSSNSSGGVLVDGVGWTSASGSAWMAPGSTTSYGIRTWNALSVEGGSASTTLTVYAAATVSVWLDSTTINGGSGTYLNWSSTGASSVDIANYGNGQAPSGRVYIAPGGTTTYTGIAYNPLGSASGASSATVTVTISNPPVLIFFGQTDGTPTNWDGDFGYDYYSYLTASGSCDSWTLTSPTAQVWSGSGSASQNITVRLNGYDYNTVYYPNYTSGNWLFQMIRGGVTSNYIYHF